MPEHKAINFVAYPAFPLHRRRRVTRRRHESPVCAPRSASLDPFAKNRDFAISQPVVAKVGGGHPARRVVARDAREDLARRLPSLIFQIEPQVGLPLRGIGAMAGVAVLREKRPDVAIKIER